MFFDFIFLTNVNLLSKYMNFRKLQKLLKTLIIKKIRMVIGNARCITGSGFHFRNKIENDI